MEYVEYPIADVLKPFVKVIWSMDSDAALPAGSPMRILPDTCVELVFHYKDPYQTTFSDTSVAVQPRSMVVAQMKRFIEIAPRGKTGIFAARFSAVGAYHFFSVPMKEIANRETGLTYVWRELADELEEKLLCAESNDERSEILQHYLRIQLSRNGYADRVIEFCLAEITRSHGQATVDDLARKSGLSNRQLLRRFDKCVGLSPKEFARIRKFIHALDTINSRPNTSFTETAYRAGYYDQAHFIHDFRKLSGMTPSEYAASRNVVY